jgi:hypothetical protein
MRKYMIEREVPGVGGLEGARAGEAAATSNSALAQIKGVQWQQSFITADRTYCVYLAESEDAIREHARLSGFPANRITPITDIWDPSTAQRCKLS